MAYIYKITNDINGRIYIGKTLLSIERRWRQHCTDSKKERCEKRPLYDAMNKYGIEHFHIEQVEECSIDVVNERERYWIEYFGSFKNGYNATKGGDGTHYADYDLVIALWNEGKNSTEIQEITSYDHTTVQRALNSANISKEERFQRQIEKTCRPVAMLDKNTNEILKVFPSVKEAERQMANGGKPQKHIGSVCLGKRKTSYGYKWKYI